MFYIYTVSLDDVQNKDEQQQQPVRQRKQKLVTIPIGVGEFPFFFIWTFIILGGQGVVLCLAYRSLLFIPLK